MLQKNKASLNEVEYLNQQFDKEFLNKKEKKTNHKKNRK